MSASSFLPSSNVFLPVRVSQGPDPMAHSTYIYYTFIEIYIYITTAVKKISQGKNGVVV